MIRTWKWAHLDKSHQRSHIFITKILALVTFFFVFWLVQRSGNCELQLSLQKWCPRPSPNFWLDVCRSKISLGSETKDVRRLCSKYANHPHAIGKWATNNTIYLASETFSLFGEHPIRGFGNFSASNQTLLTSDNAPSKRFWSVPDWLNPKKGGCIPSYHNQQSYINGLLKTAGRGQEFVCHPRQNKKF